MKIAARPVVRLFATEIDDSICCAAPAAAKSFRRAWEALDPRRRPLLVYNTGRSIGATKWLVLERRIPSPEFIIGGSGTEVHDPVDAQLAGEFRLHVAAGWNSGAVERIVGRVPGTCRQPLELLNPCKLSWYWPGAGATEVARLESQFEAAGLEVMVNYRDRAFLDVIPRRAEKWSALAWLCRRIGVSLENVVVAGATGNDRSKFVALPDVRGVNVGNASVGLAAAAEPFDPVVRHEQLARRVLAGLRRLGVLSAESNLFPARAGYGNAPAAWKGRTLGAPGRIGLG